MPLKTSVVWPVSTSKVDINVTIQSVYTGTPTCYFYTQLFIIGSRNTFNWRVWMQQVPYSLKIANLPVSTIPPQDLLQMVGLTIIQSDPYKVHGFINVTRNDRTAYHPCSSERLHFLSLMPACLWKSTSRTESPVPLYELKIEYRSILHYVHCIQTSFQCYFLEEPTIWHCCLNCY